MTNVAATTPARTPDAYDKLGDAVGNAARTGARNALDVATVSSPLVLIARGLTDPKGTAESFKRVGAAAYGAAEVMNPGLRVAREVAGTPKGRAAIQAGARGAVEVASVVSPGFALGRAIVDPEWGAERAKQTGKVVGEVAKGVEKAMDNPFTTYGQAKRAAKFVQEHPKEVERAAKIGLDILTVTNPAVAISRGISEGIKGLFGN